MFKYYLKNSICLLEGPKGQKIKPATLQVMQGLVLAGKKKIIHLQPFLKQPQQSNLVNYSSKLLQHVNKFKKFKGLVLQGMQTLPLTVQQAQNQCTHFFVGQIYFSNIISQTDTFICCIQILVKKTKPKYNPNFYYSIIDRDWHG